jgi:hypothetical protein
LKFSPIHLIGRFMEIDDSDGFLAANGHFFETISTHTHL